VVLYDNHPPKGHHRHVEGVQEGYDFVDVDKLLEDFVATCDASWGTTDGQDANDPNQSAGDALDGFATPLKLSRRAGGSVDVRVSTSPASRPRGTSSLQTASRFSVRFDPAVQAQSTSLRRW